LRADQKFNSLEELKEQLGKDEVGARGEMWDMRCEMWDMRCEIW
jgi:hypothetical protein